MTDYHDRWTQQDLAEFVEKITDGNLENDPGFGYHGPLDGDLWGTFPIGFNATQETDYVAVSNWEVLQRDLVEAYPEHAQVEEYKHWVGSIAIYVLRLNTTHEPLMRLALSYYDNYQDYPLLDEEHASTVEVRLMEEAYNSDPSLPEMILEWVTVNHAGVLATYGLTPEQFVEAYGQRLAESAMMGNGELYVDEENIGDGWGELLYEIRWEHEQTQPQLTGEE
jgi:hypothetical protein